MSSRIRNFVVAALLALCLGSVPALAGGIPPASNGIDVEYGTPHDAVSYHLETPALVGDVLVAKATCYVSLKDSVGAEIQHQEPLVNESSVTAVADGVLAIDRVDLTNHIYPTAYIWMGLPAVQSLNYHYVLVGEVWRGGVKVQDLGPYTSDTRNGEYSGITSSTSVTFCDAQAPATDHDSVSWQASCNIAPERGIAKLTATTVAKFMMVGSDGKVFQTVTASCGSITAVAAPGDTMLGVVMPVRQCHADYMAKYLLSDGRAKSVRYGYYCSVTIGDGWRTWEFAPTCTRTVSKP
jgi:hypothetical protein